MSDVPPLKSLQPWQIYVVESSLHYAFDRNTRPIAITISLTYKDVREWYYIVSEQENVQEQLDGELIFICIII